MKNSKTALPPLKTLPAFIAVAQHLSFTKAAEALHVTHSAISQNIRSLEDFLGIKLFARTPNKQTTLTLQGERYFEEIRKAMNTIVAATERELGISTSNILTVNIPMTLTMHWMIPRMPLFQAKYPDIDLRLSALGLDIDFARDNIDIAITYGYKEEWSNLYCKKLFDDELVMVASSNLIPKIYKIETLLKHFKAIYVNNALRKYDWKEWCESAEISEPKKSKRIYFQNTSQALQAVANGIGIIVTHKPFIIDEIESGQLKQVTDKILHLKKSYFLTCPKENLSVNKVNAFCRWLTEEAKLIRKKIRMLQA